MSSVRSSEKASFEKGPKEKEKPHFWFKERYRPLRGHQTEPEGVAGAEGEVGREKEGTQVSSEERQGDCEVGSTTESRKRR